ncbi:MAG: hypothetical protein HY673_00885 [Chloroflexi bacterium]|nr:hypothetical protein [Chloroflexota bacterium]
MKGARLSLILAAVLTLTAPAAAQEGHPLTGAWYGEFGTAGNPGRDLTVVMRWDGQKITGLVNPGPDAMPIKTATLDVTFAVNPPGRALTDIQYAKAGSIPPKFMVRFEVDAPNKTGGADRLVFEGTIQNLLAANRRIAGTWTSGGAKGEFSLRRL